MSEPKNVYEEFGRAKRDLWNAIVAGLRLDRIVAWLAKPGLGAPLLRMVLLLITLVGALIVRRFWPWFPYLGIAMGLSYAIGRRAR